MECAGNFEEDIGGDAVKVAVAAAKTVQGCNRNKKHP